jgi:AcrR family transcriptional regulator
MALRERARSSEDKEQRRRAILDAARLLFVERGWAGFAMTGVAERAGVVKGTLYLYWPTKEELLLAVLEELLWQWLDELDGRLDETRPLDRTRPGVGAARLAGVICDSLVSYEPLGRLLAILQTVLEHNVSRDSVLRFKRELALRVSASGARIDRLVPLAAGEGARALLHAHALLVGLQQMADSAPIVKDVLADKSLAWLEIDFARELRGSLTIYFEGLIGRVPWKGGRRHS